MPDYTVLDATVSYDLTDATEVYLRVQNLTDEDYQQVNGYATAGRSVYLGLQAKF
jgi:vitamin B12 transporter